MLERYLRHSLIDWFSQEQVQAANIAVIGAGATGNEVVKNLVLLGAGYIDVFDFDRVEAHNLTRSIFLREEDIGLDKARSVARRAAQVDPNVRVGAVSGDFWDTLSLSRLAAYDAVICCVDNFEARLRLNQMCLIVGVDLINAAIDSRHATVELFPLSRADVACYACHLPDSAYQRMAERYSCAGLKKAAWQERKVPTTAITASLAGALATSVALRLASDAASGAFRIFCDSRGGASARAMLERRPDCPGCAGFAVRPTRIRTRDAWMSALSGATPGADESVIVRLSEPVIVGCMCVRCGAERDADAVRLRRARDFDERITCCESCAARSMQVDIRDRFTAAELKSCFGECPPPVKYLLAHAGDRFVCVDLEEDEHE
jgi:molybdopterin/thiamine biosynthesis adenylyltransferase